MIYKGHDLRVEKGHIRVLNLKTGVTWTEDSIKEAKHEIDVISSIQEAIYKGGDAIEKSV